MSANWLADVAAALPGIGALLTLWRVTLRQRIALHRLARAINRQEQTIAALEGRPPRTVHPFTDTDDE